MGITECESPRMATVIWRARRRTFCASVRVVTVHDRFSGRTLPEHSLSREVHRALSVSSCRCNTSDRTRCVAWRRAVLRGFEHARHGISAIHDDSECRNRRRDDTANAHGATGQCAAARTTVR